MVAAVGAELTVSRSPQGWPDRIRRYRLLVDGKAVASLKRGQSVSVPVQPGHHRIWMRIDWCRSRILDVELGDNERIVLTCRSGVRLRLLLFPVYLTVLRARYIGLEEERREPVIVTGFAGGRCRRDPHRRKGGRGLPSDPQGCARRLRRLRGPRYE
jgi:hypothetical protein